MELLLVGAVFYVGFVYILFKYYPTKEQRIRHHKEADEMSYHKRKNFSARCKNDLQKTDWLTGMKK